MKRLTLASLMLVSLQVSAFSLPSAPSSPSGYNEIRTQSGSVCRSSIGGNLQVYGGALTSNGDEGNPYGYHAANGTNDEDGLYIGFAYSFGGGKQMDCTRLADIETERALIELNKLKSDIKALEQIRELQLLETEGHLPKLSRR